MPGTSRCSVWKLYYYYYNILGAVLSMLRVSAFSAEGKQNRMVLQRNDFPCQTFYLVLPLAWLLTGHPWVCKLLGAGRGL